MTRTMLAAMALGLPMLVAAQGVWRCGPDGRSYSDTPCAEGRRLDVAVEARPAADVQAAEARAAQDNRLAEAMRRDRLAREAASRGNGLAAVGPQTTAVKPAKPGRPLSKQAAQARPQLHPEAHGTWRATPPSSRRARG